MRKRLAIVPLACLGLALAALLVLSRPPPKEAPNEDEIASLPATYPADLQVAEFGQDADQPIESGFVFLDGRYLDAPYVVKRVGLAIYINDAQVVRPTTWPPRQSDRADVDPPMPASFTRDTSLHDPVLYDYWSKKAVYLRRHFSPEDEARLWTETIRSLPFVKEAKIHPLFPDGMVVTTWSGETQNWAIQADRTPMPPVTKESVLKGLDKKLELYRKMLAEGSCLWLFSKGGASSYNEDRARRDLPGLVAMLRSDISQEEKLAELEKAGFPATEPFARIVTGFSASDQLEKRLAKLLQGASPEATPAGK